MVWKWMTFTVTIALMATLWLWGHAETRLHQSKTAAAEQTLEARALEGRLDHLTKRWATVRGQSLDEAIVIRALDKLSDEMLEEMDERGLTE